MIYVFIYGSLKLGKQNSYILNGFEGIATETVDDFVMIDLGHFPGVVESNKANNSIKGELYKVNVDTLLIIDTLESHPYLYIRKLIELVTGDFAWMYFFNGNYVPNDAEIIKSGDWQ